MATTEGRPIRWVGLAAATRLAGVNRMTVHRAAARGDLPFAETPVGRLFTREDVLEWAQRRKSERGAEQ
jgi:predicted site-specific integrase-resolvase